jgi:acetyl esterase
MPNLDKTADEKPDIDPILMKVLDKVPFRLSAEDGIEAARQRLRDLKRRALHPELRVEDRTVEGPAGPLELRIYWPPNHSTSQASPPVVMFFHGGGFVMGDLDTHDGTCRQHAVGANAIVVSVDYRLAPEHPYDAALDEGVYAAPGLADPGAPVSRRAAADLVAAVADSAGVHPAHSLSYATSGEEAP